MNPMESSQQDAAPTAQGSERRCEAGRRWRCPPRHARCELPEGHGGEHMNGLDTWKSVAMLTAEVLAELDAEANR